MAEIMAKL